ncbi:MAG: glycosyltransferase family 2 protein [Labilithrix sp.]
MRLAVLMPVYEEGERLASTLRELGDQLGPEHHATVFVVDDGSRRSPVEAGALPRAENVRVVLARHPVNLGQGAAIETARRLALHERWSGPSAFDAYVTMDSDGQHRPEDAVALARAIADGADVALGDRFAGSSNVPFTRRVLLQLARIFERWTTGLVLSDAHNGLRAFSARAIVKMRLRQNRMAHATELTRRISNAKLKLVEVPVSVRYTAETLAKGQTAGGALAILVDLFQGFLFGSPE